MTLLYTHPDCVAHNPGPGHPERPERLIAILKALDAAEFSTLDRREAPRATRAQIERVHSAAHFDDVMAAVPTEDFSWLDPDTAMSPRSDQAALRAAGAVTAAIGAVVDGEAQTAFCAVRPPGHHAEPDRAMGFCLFNSVAIGAAEAQSVHSIERIAIVDFDVHHGNGTEAMTASQPNWLYASTHQWPLYPGTGAERDHGPYRNILNATLPPGAGSDEFRTAFIERILPAIDIFAPGLILISAGFDAHRCDPLANLRLETEDFAWATERLCALAQNHCAGRVVSTLEGGYDLDALADATAAHVRTLMSAERQT